MSLPNQELLFMPATKAASLIRSRKLSPVEYTEAVLKQIEAGQPRLRPFATVTADLARKQAKEAEQAVVEGKPLGPLHGVPVNIKDLFATAGVLTAYGSAVYGENIPTADDVLVRRLNQAGAIMVGKSTTPEFGHKGLTDSPVFGVSRNPWNPERTTGGSSGGAAAAVAAGMGPLGLGTDGAGSIRIPAAACGVVGLKPTTGAVPYEQAVDTFNNYACAGPLVRTIADTALMQSVLTGPEPLDPWTQAAPAFGQISPKLFSDDLSGVRIGYIPVMADPRIDPDVAANTKAALDVFAAAGADIEEVAAKIDWIPDEARIMYFGNIAVSFGGHVEKWREKMDPMLLDFIKWGQQSSMADYRKAQMARTRLFRSIQMLFETYDFLITPTLPRPALPATDGGGDLMKGWNAFLYPFNLSGHPALSVPSGWDKESLPTAVQIVAPWWKDADTLRLGAVLERERPWADRIPPVLA